MENQTVQKHLRITGRVQGVGFRYFTRKNAADLNVKGWVKNMTDGSVETVIAGEPANVEEMKKRLFEGPRSARVENVEELPQDGTTETFHDFRVRR
jgi:acylphosphatase